MNPIYVAIDKMGVGEARILADELRGAIGGLKIGLTFWMRHNYSVIRHVTAGYNWFMDFKFFDIGDQMDGAIRAAVPQLPQFISIHIDPRDSDSPKAAVKAAHEESKELNVRRPLILAVAALTTMEISPAEVLVKAYHAQSCGLDGVICSGLEAGVLRSELRRDFVLLTPGIRPAGSPTDDHRRPCTPKQSIDNGADYLVIGRPITKASNPRQAALDILESIDTNTEFT